MADWNKPLSLRQLVSLLALLAAIAIVIVMVRHTIHHQNDASRQAQCLVNAPLNWDCRNHPTGYPRQP